LGAAGFRVRRGLDRTIRKDIGIRLGGALSPSDAWLFLHEIKMAGLHSRGSPHTGPA